jgi:hypothetical protein
MTCCLTICVASAAEPTISPAISEDAIGGVVASATGPEAGVWVIAETYDLKTDFIKIVVTDDHGRYVLPELPKAHYQVWVRGYGLVDSDAVAATPGQTLALTAKLAPNPRAAADYYPANYWFALLRPPAPSEFPGTGPNGNGISPLMHTQQEWLGHMKENCTQCHQLGDLVTRTLDGRGNSAEAWAERIQNGTGKVDDPRIDKLVTLYRALMGNNLVRFGRHRALQMFGDWTDRIAAGELPPSAPPRPAGIERNIVLTLHGWSHGADGVSQETHDEVSTDKRDPTINANGPVYGAVRHYGEYATFDPKTGEAVNIDIPGVGPTSRHNEENGAHNPMIDQKDRVWTTLANKEGDDPEYCSNGALNKYAQYFPNGSSVGRHVAVYDPATKNVALIPTCFSSHHLNFARDKDNTLYFSGDSNVMGWIDTKIWDETHDPEKSEGWCPFVLDTSGDGKIDPDRANWNFIPNPYAGTGEGAGSVADKAGTPEASKTLDPRKDTRLTSFLYGMNVSPLDGSLWYVKVEPNTPSGILRFTPGANPPETCKTEYYEPPKGPDGFYPAFDGRGVDLDSKGIAWVSFGSGALGRFDRAKCKVLSGPTATGQQCPEGWSFYESPGPKIAGTTAAADFHYLVWVDLYNAFGLGKDVPIITGTNSDSLIAFLPDTRTWVTMRVPYPMGFYTRGLDARIDNPKTGWKGREIWASYDVAQQAHLHIEGGDQKLVEFQLRPTPLVH